MTKPRDPERLKRILARLEARKAARVPVEPAIVEVPFGVGADRKLSHF
jgi:hypothetical protein